MKDPDVDVGRMSAENAQGRAPLRREEAHRAIIARGEELGIVRREGDMEDRVAVAAVGDKALRMPRRPQAHAAILSR